MKYLTADEVRRLRSDVEAKAAKAGANGRTLAVRNWALLDTLLNSGLRASEVAALTVGDCLLGYGQSSLLVRRGKGGKAREVVISGDLKKHLKQYLSGLVVVLTSHVFPGERGQLTRNGVWRIVKGLMREVGLDSRYSTHSCRHTYATHLYRASGRDLEVVQEQLGHVDIRTTAIYAKVTKEDKQAAVEVMSRSLRDSQRKTGSGASIRLSRRVTSIDTV